MTDEIVTETLENGMVIDANTGELMEYHNAEIEQLALLESAWKALEQAQTFNEFKTIRSQASAAKTLMRKLGMSREAQNGAAKIHLAASLRMGDWLRNKVEKASGAASNKYETRLHSATASTECDTYADLGIEKTDAFRLQRLYDWEKETQGASKAVQALQDKETELVVSKLISKAVSFFKVEKRIYDIEQQAAEIASSSPEVPIGPFHVISIDPPWPYGTEYDPNGRRAANPYPEMSLEEIEAIKLPAAEDCVLWLWTTHKFMRHSFKLLDTWGFRDVAILTWVKDRMGLGSWLRSQSEFCIMAIKGKPPIRLTNQTTVIQGPLREHSRKPDSFYSLVNSLCVGAKLDYFSREKRDGWEQVGNTLELFEEAV